LGEGLDERLGARREGGGGGGGGEGGAVLGAFVDGGGRARAFREGSLHPAVLAPPDGLEVPSGGEVAQVGRREEGFRVAVEAPLGAPQRFARSFAMLRLAPARRRFRIGDFGRSLSGGGFGG